MWNVDVFNHATEKSLPSVRVCVVHHSFEYYMLDCLSAGRKDLGGTHFWLDMMTSTQQYDCAFEAWRLTTTLPFSPAPDEVEVIESMM